MWIYAVCFVTGYLESLGTIQISTDLIYDVDFSRKKIPDVSLGRNNKKQIYRSIEIMQCIFPNSDPIIENIIIRQERTRVKP